MKSIVLLFVIPVTAYSQIGLVAQYPFSGNANDITGNGNNGTVNGAILTNDRFGNPNSAYYFDGVNDYIYLGTNFPFTSHTYAAWFRLDSVYPSGIIELISKLNNGPYDLMNSEMTPGGMTIGTGSTWDGVGLSQVTINSATWYHIAASYDAAINMVSMFVNGVKTDSNYISGYVDVANTPVFVGARPYWSGNNGTSFFFKGRIDDICIYNRPITADEADSLYNDGLMTYVQNQIQDVPLLYTQVYNLWGQLVYRGEGELPDSLPAGVYFLRSTHTNGAVTTRKIFIQ